MKLSITALITGALCVSALVLAPACSVPVTDAGPEQDPGAAEPGETTDTTQDPLTGDQAVSRAHEWANAGLLYCGAPNHAYDSAICNYQCNRTDNAAWDPYRSDCSGLVSWAWGLPAPGRTTGAFAPFNTQVTSVINAADLQPGDAINSAEHIMLFEKWITFGHRARFVEEHSCGTPARVIDLDVTINGSSIVRTDWTSNPFIAIRVHGIQPPADCTAQETSNAAQFGCACVNHQGNGGFCPGTGCTSQETTNAAQFGCSCVDHQGNGGYCPGTGCTAKETNDAAQFGCSCVDHSANGGYCPGTGCTAKETNDAAKFGCSCVDHKANGGFCPGTGCTAKETSDAAKFGCGCVDHKAAGGFCAGNGCTAKETNDCSAKGKTCSVHKCSP